MKKIIRLTEGDLHRIVNESVNKILKEAFKSPKLDALAKQHGGIRKSAYGYLDNNDLSISELTDDMIGDEAVGAEDGDFTGIANNAVNFKDGTHLPITNMQAARQMQKNWDDTQNERLRYNNSGNYQKRMPTVFNRALRRDLQTANRVKNDPNKSYSDKKHWAEWENRVRPEIRKAYEKQGNLEQLMQQIK